MLHHPELMRHLAAERAETLRRAALPRAPRPPQAASDLSQIELRLCCVGDDDSLAELATLAERPVPPGRSVVALVNGRLVAALPLAGGQMLSDPFVRTAHLRPLLELRANQLREPSRRRWLVPRYVSLIRGSTHA